RRTPFLPGRLDLAVGEERASQYVTPVGLVGQVGQRARLERVVEGGAFALGVLAFVAQAGWGEHARGTERQGGARGEIGEMEMSRHERERFRSRGRGSANGRARRGV